MQGTSNHLTLPSFQFPLPLPPPSLSFLSSLLPPPTSCPPQWCNIPPPQTCSNTCTRIQNFTVVRKRLHVHVWQSWIEIKHYSVAYFDHIIKYCNRNFIEGGAHTHFVDLSGVHVSILCMSPTLTRSSALQTITQLKCATEMIDFYPGLPDVINNDLAMSFFLQ